MTNVVNILLLDEEDLMREATALLLVNRGAHVEKTKTIEDAMTQLERQTFDVIVVDVPEKSVDHECWVSRASRAHHRASGSWFVQINRS